MQSVSGFEKKFVYFIVFLPIIFGFFSLLKVSIVFPVYTFVVVLLLLYSIYRKVNISSLVLLALLCIIVAVTIASGGFQYFFNQDVYLFLYLIIIFIFSFSNKSVGKVLIENDKVIVISTVCYILLLLISVIFFSGFRQFDEYNNYNVLFGPYHFSHTCAYDLIFYTILMLFYIHNKKRKISGLLILFSLIVLILLTQVRTAFLALLFIGIYEIFFSKYLKKKLKIFMIFVLASLFITLIIISFVNVSFLSNIPFLSKTIEAYEDGNITNGRDTFIKIAIEHFKELPFFNKIFGITVEEVRNLNFEEIGLKIHCHNDFFTILLGYGILGLGVFLFSIFAFIKNNYKIPFIIFLSIFLNTSNNSLEA